jgi:tRNA (guanine37-N1)-methyltransferase
VRIDVFTIFPDVVAGYCGTSVLGRATGAGALEVRVHDLRQGAVDPRRSVDDSPFGGGAGMVLMAEPLFRSVESVPDLPRPLFLLAPGGRRFDQSVAAELAARGDGPGGGFSLLCGRYEGVDQRVADHLVDDELSVGDFVLAGGELAALCVVEAVARLRPGVLGNEDSADDESFTTGLLEYPQYTRPASFRGWEVPEVLRSGDHGAVAAWRRTHALERTAERRPDLIERLVRGSALSPNDVQALSEHGYDVLSGTEQSEQEKTQHTDGPERAKDAPHAPH